MPPEICTTPLARYAGVERRATAEAPHVAVDVMAHQDGTRYAWLISQADRELTVKPVQGKGLRLDQDTVTLGPYGVASPTTVAPALRAGHA